MSALRESAVLAVRRLGVRFTAASVLFALAAVLVIARLERAQAPHRAADHTLAGVVFGWAVPLLALAVVARAAQHGRIDAAVLGVTRHGGDRRLAVLGLVIVVGALASVASAVMALTGVLVAHGRLDLAALRDAVTAAWIGALGGAVYAAWFSLASSFAQGGRGRAAFLIADWVLGGAAGLAAAPWPRAHLRSLLGGAPVLDLPSWQSTATLYALLFAYLAALLGRTPR